MTDSEGRMSDTKRPYPPTATRTIDANLLKLWSRVTAPPSGRLMSILVRVEGVEPTCPYGQRILSASRLPFRHTRIMYNYYTADSQNAKKNLHLRLRWQPGALRVFSLNPSQPSGTVLKRLRFASLL